MDGTKNSEGATAPDEHEPPGPDVWAPFIDDAVRMHAAMFKVFDSRVASFPTDKGEHGAGLVKDTVHHKMPLHDMKMDYEIPLKTGVYSLDAIPVLSYDPETQILVIDASGDHAELAAHLKVGGQHLVASRDSDFFKQSVGDDHMSHLESETNKANREREWFSRLGLHSLSHGHDDDLSARPIGFVLKVIGKVQGASLDASTVSLRVEVEQDATQIMHGDHSINVEYDHTLPVRGELRSKEQLERLTAWKHPDEEHRRLQNLVDYGMCDEICKDSFFIPAWHNYACDDDQSDCYNELCIECYEWNKEIDAFNFNYNAAANSGTGGPTVDPYVILDPIVKCNGCYAYVGASVQIAIKWKVGWTGATFQAFVVKTTGSVKYASEVRIESPQNSFTKQAELLRQDICPSVVSIPTLGITITPTCILGVEAVINSDFTGHISMPSGFDVTQSLGAAYAKGTPTAGQTASGSWSSLSQGSWSYTDPTIQTSNTLSLTAASVEGTIDARVELAVAITMANLITLTGTGVVALRPYVGAALALGTSGGTSTVAQTPTPQVLALSTPQSVATGNDVVKTGENMKIMVNMAAIDMTGQANLVAELINDCWVDNEYLLLLDEQFCIASNVDTRSCTNDDSVIDSYGDTCTNWYDKYPTTCGDYDGGAFVAATACCQCGRATGTCSNDDTVSDPDGDTCTGYYDANPTDCGKYDSDTFIASDACCACFSYVPFTVWIPWHDEIDISGTAADGTACSKTFKIEAYLKGMTSSIATTNRFEIDGYGACDGVLTSPGDGATVSFDGSHSFTWTTTDMVHFKAGSIADSGVLATETKVLLSLELGRRVWGATETNCNLGTYGASDARCQHKCQGTLSCPFGSTGGVDYTVTYMADSWGYSWEYCECWETVQITSEAGTANDGSLTFDFSHNLDGNGRAFDFADPNDKNYNADYALLGGYFAGYAVITGKQNSLIWSWSPGYFCTNYNTAWCATFRSGSECARRRLESGGVQKGRVQKKAPSVKGLPANDKLVRAGPTEPKAANIRRRLFRDYSTHSQKLERHLGHGSEAERRRSLQATTATTYTISPYYGLDMAVNFLSIDLTVGYTGYSFTTRLWTTTGADYIFTLIDKTDLTTITWGLAGSGQTGTLQAQGATTCVLTPAPTAAPTTPRPTNPPTLRPTSHPTWPERRWDWPKWVAEHGDGSADANADKHSWDKYAGHYPDLNYMIGQLRTAEKYTSRDAVAGFPGSDASVGGAHKIGTATFYHPAKRHWFQHGIAEMRHAWLQKVPGRENQPRTGY